MDTLVDTWLGTPRSLTPRQFVRAQQTVGKRGRVRIRDFGDGYPELLIGIRCLFAEAMRRGMHGFPTVLESKPNRVFVLEVFRPRAVGR